MPGAMLKELVKRIPVIGDLARAALGRGDDRRQARFVSGDYWEDRYRAGGNSGAGSYSRLARNKAEVLNRFVAENRIESVIEFGSGDGAQLRLAVYPRYTGVDVSRTVLDQTIRDFAGDPTKRFLHTAEVTAADQADLALSLDVIYHLIEDAVFEAYMWQLFDAARRHVIVYSSNSERPSGAVHVRHRRFTDWVVRHRPDFILTRELKNPNPEEAGDPENTSFADFYFFERGAPAS